MDVVDDMINFAYFLMYLEYGIYNRFIVPQIKQKYKRYFAVSANFF